MNELIFFGHIFSVVFLTFMALRIGRDALIVLTVLLAMLANFFVLKQMLLFGWNVTCSDVFAVGSILSLNLLQEHFGKETATRTTTLCFFGMAFFGLMSKIHLLYTPSPSDYSQLSYLTLLSPTPRLLLASLLSFYLVQRFDVFFFAFLRKRYLGWRWRQILSLVTSQLLDTLLFSFLGLYGLVDSLTSILVVSFLIKVMVIFGMTLFSTPLKKRASRAI